jgi:hypothetical protein
VDRPTPHSSARAAEDLLTRLNSAQAVADHLTQHNSVPVAVDLQVQLKQEQVVEREQVVAARQIPLP